MTKANRLLKKLFKQRSYPAISPLTECPRSRVKTYYEDGTRKYNYEGIVEFGFLPTAVWTCSDREIATYCDEYIARKVSYPCYDCSGQLFTSYISFHRNPNASVSFVNHMYLDV